MKDAQQMTEKWIEETNHAEDAIQEAVRRAQDHAYQLGLAAGQRQRDDLLAACRRAVLALAAASEKDQAFSADYEAVSAAIEEATK